MKESELILNPDGSIYHLSLLPDDIAPTVIFIGDPERVHLISRHFDRLEFKKQRREFITHTGWIGDKRLTVISTGIGTDNIDIVLNELDALVNIDFETKTIKPSLTSLNIIRLGTSGSIHPDVHMDEVLVSRYAVGTDSLGNYYGANKSPHPVLPPWSYFVKAHNFNLNEFHGTLKEGITLTCPGFYGPQGRSLRISGDYDLSIDRLSEIEINGLNVTNIDMETAGIYLLAHTLGHKAISFNAIIAQRNHGYFNQDHSVTINRMISDVLSWIVKSNI